MFPKQQCAWDYVGKRLEVLPYNRKAVKPYNRKKGGLAQLARAPALQAGGHRFDPDILHSFLIYGEIVL